MSHPLTPEDPAQGPAPAAEPLSREPTPVLFRRQDYWRSDDLAQSDQKVFQPPYYHAMMPGQPKPSFS